MQTLYAPTVTQKYGKNGFFGYFHAKIYVLPFCRNTIICRADQGASFWDNRFSCKFYRTPTVTQNAGFRHFSQKRLLLGILNPSIK